MTSLIKEARRTSY